jgi:hypothetical protein
MSRLFSFFFEKPQMTLIGLAFVLLRYGSPVGALGFIRERKT